MLIRIAEAFDLASDDCVMIGDNYSDLEAARSAGMSAVLVLTGHGPIHRERALRDGFEIASDLQSWVKSRSTEVPDAERFF